MSSFPVMGARFQRLEQPDDEENRPARSAFPPSAPLGIHGLQNEADIENISIKPSLEYGADDFNDPVPGTEHMKTGSRISSFEAPLLQAGV
jgi:hypothetical protein